MFHRQVSDGGEQISFQGGARRIEALWMTEQTEETVVRDIFREFLRAKQTIGEAKHRVTVMFVERQESRFVAATRQCQQSFVCHAFGQLPFCPRVRWESLPIPYYRQSRKRYAAAAKNS